MGKTRKPDKSGTGFIKTEIDIDNLTFCVDFTGKDTHKIWNPKTSSLEETTSNYFNSESVLFYVSNSYWFANRSIYRNLITAIEDYKNGQKNNSQYKYILRHILPYYFNFRHFVETELKALSIAVKRITAIANHNLTNLVDDLIDGVKSLTLESKGVFLKKQEELEEKKTIVLQILHNLGNNINEYVKLEPSDDYYRFIFDKDFQCGNPVVKLDLNLTEQLFSNIVSNFREIETELHNIMYFYHLI